MGNSSRLVAGYKFKIQTSGASLIIIITLLCFLLILTIGVIALSVNNSREQRDKLRRQDLHLINTVQEIYFDHHQRFGLQSDLISDRLLNSLLVDPLTGSPYEIFLNPGKDEWCTWAKAEALPYYYVYDEYGLRTILQPPNNLTNCKQTI